jgi:hypothetical protein
MFLCVGCFQRVSFTAVVLILKLLLSAFHSVECKFTSFLIFFPSGLLVFFAMLCQL